MKRGELAISRRTVALIAVVLAIAVPMAYGQDQTFTLCRSDDPTNSRFYCTGQGGLCPASHVTVNDGFDNVNSCEQACENSLQGQYASYGCTSTASDGDGGTTPPAETQENAGSYSMCLKDNKLYCQENKCQAGYSTVAEGVFEDLIDCVADCASVTFEEGYSCAHTATLDLCRKGNSYECRNPGAGDNCEDWGETRERSFDSPELCEQERQNRMSGQAALTPPEGANSCSQACGRNAISAECLDYNPNYRAYSSFQGGNYNYNQYGGRYDATYGSGGFTTGAYGQFRVVSGNYCGNNRQCWCYSVGYHVSFASVQRIQDYMPLNSEQAKEKVLDELGSTVMNPPVVIDTGKTNQGYVDEITCDVSVKFAGATISRIQNCNDDVTAPQKFFISEGDDTPIGLSGTIGTKSSHCNGLQYTCLITRDAGCRYDEDWKGIKPRIGYKPNECRSDEYSITKKQHMKTNWGKLLSIPCMVGGVGTIVVGALTENPEAVRYGIQATEFCAGMYLGSDMCANTQAATQITINQQGISVGVNRDGIAVGGTVPLPSGSQQQQQNPGGISPTEAQTATTSTLGAADALRQGTKGITVANSIQMIGSGFGVGCAVAPKFKNGEEIKCWNVCGKKARSLPSDVPECPYGSFSIYDDSDGFKSPLYGTYTGGNCNLVDVTPENNPIQHINVVVTTPDGDRQLDVPAPNGIITRSIAPADLGFTKSFPAGKYEIAISIPGNALDPIAAVAGGS